MSTTGDAAVPVPAVPPETAAATGGTGGASAAAAKERAARWSVAASGALAAGKLAAGLVSGSLALLSEAAHSLADTAATVVTWLAVRAAGKPADTEHQYGHGKIESVAALVETGVLFALALAVLAQAVRRVVAGDAQPLAAAPLAIGVVCASLLVDANRIRTLRRVARRTGSQALAADALHFASDMAGSVAVLLGLAAAQLGVPHADTAAAAAVAGFITVAGWRLGRRALDTLLDAAPAGLAERLRAALAAAPGVVAVESLRLRTDGSKVFAEAVVALSRALSFGEVEEVKARALKAVAEKFPDTEMTLIARPRTLDNASVRERVLLAALRRGLPLHHITVQFVGEGEARKLCVSFDMEVDGAMPLGGAHTLAEDFKRELLGLFGAGAEVEPHVEPLDARALAGADAPEAETRKVAAALAAGAAKSEHLREIHDVRVRETPAGRVVNYHCRADGALPVEDVHAEMDELEHEIRAAMPGIKRIVGHADEAHAPAPAAAPEPSATSPATA
ncbi:MAG: cation diffusion facilitator family transporter [Puniceicoccales bacterium]|jgi:cation diffusion facilitator family transporter|nr:cation diffusion facilitator family transporter [Puniceicoccales bacterium]